MAMCLFCNCETIVLKISFQNKNLDEHQLQILKTIYTRCINLNVPNISLLDGAAGTGKTTLIVNLVLQLIYGDELPGPLSILLCSKSNRNIDDLTLKLINIRDHTDGEYYPICLS